MAADILLVTPCSLVHKYQCCGRTFCAHLEGRRLDVTLCTSDLHFRSSQFESQAEHWLFLDILLFS
jgi:hypothetical protein